MDHFKHKRKTEEVVISEEEQKETKDLIDIVFGNSLRRLFGDIKISKDFEKPINLENLKLKLNSDLSEEEALEEMTKIGFDLLPENLQLKKELRPKMIFDIVKSDLKKTAEDRKKIYQDFLSDAAYIYLTNNSLEYIKPFIFNLVFLNEDRSVYLKEEYKGCIHIFPKNRQDLNTRSAISFSFMLNKFVFNTFESVRRAKDFYSQPTVFGVENVFNEEGDILKRIYHSRDERKIVLDRTIFCKKKVENRKSKDIELKNLSDAEEESLLEIVNDLTNESGDEKNDKDEKENKGKPMTGSIDDITSNLKETIGKHTEALEKSKRKIGFSCSRSGDF